MTSWRPPPEIRVKALGLHWRHDRLLAAEVRDDHGRVKGVRPIGGGVEFGELAEAAVLREFKEELGVDVVVLRGPLVMENLYAHEGARGHEVLFIFDVGFSEGALEKREHLEFQDDDGARCVARWFDLNDLDRDGRPDLYPKGLKSLLAARRS